MSLSVDPEVGVADSGNIENDLPELFVRVGEAAKAAGKAWTLLIDEVQYLRSSDLAALIVALHKISQKDLPVVFFGAGLPQVAALSGDAKSYAERLFHYPAVGHCSLMMQRAPSGNPWKVRVKKSARTHWMRFFTKPKGIPTFFKNGAINVGIFHRVGKSNLPMHRGLPEKQPGAWMMDSSRSGLTGSRPKSEMMSLSWPNWGRAPTAHQT